MIRLPFSSSSQASRRLRAAGLCLLSALLPGLWDNPQAAAQQSPRRVLRRLSPGGSGPITYQFREIFEFPDSGGPVYSLAWSPDGSRLASAGGRNLLLWDPYAHIRVATMSGHQSLIWGVAWSPDGNLLASASADGTVRLWDAHNYRRLATLETDWAMTVAWSPDGERLAVGNAYGLIEIFDVATRAVLVEIPLARFIICAAWSGDGQTLAVGDLDGWITLWDPVTGTRLGQWRPNGIGGGDTNGIAWSPNDSLLASAHQRGSIWVWDPDTHEALHRLEAHHGWARGVAFSPDGRLLLTSGEDNTATVWSTETWTRLASLPCGSLPLWSVGWSPDGSHFALGSGLYENTGSGAVFLWQVIREWQ